MGEERVKGGRRGGLKVGGERRVKGRREEG